MSESEKNKTAGLLGMLGLCARAGRLICGTSLICDALRDKKEIFIVLMADSVSENTKKRLSDKCRYYSVRLERVKVTAGELAHALGKSGELAAAAVTDEHFAAGLEKWL